MNIQLVFTNTFFGCPRKGIECLIKSVIAQTFLVNFIGLLLCWKARSTDYHILMPGLIKGINKILSILYLYIKYNICMPESRGEEEW